MREFKTEMKDPLEKSGAGMKELVGRSEAGMEKLLKAG